MLIMIKLNVCNNLDQKWFLFKNVDYLFRLLFSCF